MATLDPAALLAAYDSQLRGRVPEKPLPGVGYERDGPLLRFTGFGDQGWVVYRDLGGLQGAALDDLIERQVRVFAERGERFEWKYHGHDLPPDLPERLHAAGFRPEEQETVVIARVADIAGAPSPPDGVTLRGVTGRADLERIAAMEEAVWGDDHSWLPDGLGKELSADPGGLSIVVAEGDGTVVCAAWMRYEHGTDFATLWGGATLPEWRGRGIYKATVAYRANLASERGFSLLEVDASDDSRPILERLGFVPVTTTTPYIWSPA
jgi:GNAT superfamily N-acetyltransferase